jgi:beta-xylosidase
MTAKPLALLILLLLTVGCSSSTPAPSSTKSSKRSSPGGSATFANPVVVADFPDPGLLAEGGTFHLYGTQGGGANIQTLTSTDLVHWTAGDDALPEVGSWASTGNTWAPEVVKVGARYLLFYVAHDDASGKQCIGRASASTPEGPFRDTSPSPLVCQAGQGGSIDADPVRDPDGHLYLYWKNDGNCCDRPVRLWGQRLSAAGTSLVGHPVALLSNTKAWQGNLIEAPEMVTHGADHLLFYSANDYASTSYAVGYARCAGPLGPCTDASEDPVLASNKAAAGPGHCFVFTVGDQTWMLYHAWPPDAIGSEVPGRQLWLDRVTWDGDTPVVHGPTATRQPVPALSG